MTNKHPVEIDGVTGEIETLPPQKNQRYRCKLDSMSDVKREMAKVYRESRSNIIDPADASKQVWMLQALAKVIADSKDTVQAIDHKPKTLADFYGER